MSYASATKQNRLPLDQQPKPDPALLEGQHSDDDLSHSTASDEKVHVVTRDEFEHEKDTSDSDNRDHVYLTAEDAKPSDDEIARKAQADAQKVEKKAKQAKDEVKAEAKDAKDATERKAKEAKDAAERKARDVKETTKREASKAADKAEETYDNVAREAKDAKDTVKREASKAYNETAENLDKAAQATKQEVDELSEKGKAAYNKMSKAAREDWHRLSKESKHAWDEAKASNVGQELQKPEVWGSLLGVSNLAVIGSVAYFAYANWNRPRWDRRVVSATVLAVGSWFGLQGYLIPQTDAVRQRRQ